MVNVSSVDLFMNQLPPRDPNATTHSVARANVRVELGPDTYIQIRGIHVVVNDNGGRFISMPAKRKSDNTWMDVVSVSEDIERSVRYAVIRAYRERVARDSAPAAQVSTVATSAPIASVAQRCTQAKVFSDSIKATEDGNPDAAIRFSITVAGVDYSVEEGSRKILQHILRSPSVLIPVVAKVHAEDFADVLDAASL